MSEEEKWDILYRLEVTLELMDLGHVLAPVQVWYDEQDENVSPDDFWRQQADTLLDATAIPSEYGVFYNSEPDWQEAARVV